MLVRIIQAVIILTAFHLHAGQIVLKNGKTLPCEGPYEVKGNMVHYKKGGEIFQLPLKIVDLDKSSADYEAPKEIPKKKDEEVLIKSNDVRRKRRNVAFHEMVDHSVVTTEKQSISIDEKAMAKKYKSDDMHGVSPYEKRFVHFIFWSACRRGEVEDVQFMLAKGASFEGAGYDLYEQPIVAAVRQGHVKIVGMLIKAGAKLNPYGKDGQTPLLISLNRKGSKFEQIFGMLVKAGANVNAPSEELETPVEVAIEKHKSQILAVLLSEDANPNSLTKNRDYPIFKAIGKYDAEKTGMLLEPGLLLSRGGLLAIPRWLKLPGLTV